jgi:fructose-1-phosphate kinase PfkB-like protein
VLDFRGEGLLGVLDLQPLVVKPNREELGQTGGRELSSDDDLLEAMRSVNDRGAHWVVVTQGARPVWLSSRSEVYRLDPPQVASVVNPIGCGDAVSAGIAHALCGGKSMVEAVRYGVAAAADNLGQLLACRVDPTRVANWCERVQVQRIV